MEPTVFNYLRSCDDQFEAKKFAENELDTATDCCCDEEICVIKDDVIVAKGTSLGTVCVFDPIMLRDQPGCIDLILTFGGDGLLMHCNTLFGGETSGPVPPTMCFDFGSLGFLAPFCYSEFQTEVRCIRRARPDGDFVNCCMDLIVCTGRSPL